MLLSEKLLTTVFGISVKTKSFFRTIGQNDKVLCFLKLYYRNDNYIRKMFKPLERDPSKIC